MKNTASNVQRYSAPFFWFPLLTALILAPSAYWAASVALSGVRPRWFAVFIGCIFFFAIISAVALFSRAIQERRKKRLEAVNEKRLTRR